MIPVFPLFVTEIRAPSVAEAALSARLHENQYTDEFTPLHDSPVIVTGVVLDVENIDDTVSRAAVKPTPPLSAVQEQDVPLQVMCCPAEHVG